MKNILKILLNRARLPFHAFINPKKLLQEILFFRTLKILRFIFFYILGYFYVFILVFMHLIKL